MWCNQEFIGSHIHGSAATNLCFFPIICHGVNSSLAVFVTSFLVLINLSHPPVIQPTPLTPPPWAEPPFDVWSFPTFQHPWTKVLTRTVSFTSYPWTQQARSKSWAWHFVLGLNDIQSLIGRQRRSLARKKNKNTLLNRHIPPKNSWSFLILWIPKHKQNA